MESSDLNGLKVSPRPKPMYTDVDGTILLSSDSENDDQVTIERPLARKRKAVAIATRAVASRSDEGRHRKHTEAIVSNLKTHATINKTTKDKAGEEDVVIVSSTDQAIRPISTHVTMKTKEGNGGENECLLVGSMGINALTDFPHSRENCVLVPMAKAWNGKANRYFCQHCYCYVCDIPAKDCPRWQAHCNARHKNKKWQNHRKRVRKTKKVQASKKEHQSTRSEEEGDQTAARTEETVIEIDSDSDDEVIVLPNAPATKPANGDPSSARTKETVIELDSDSDDEATTPPTLPVDEEERQPARTEETVIDIDSDSDEDETAPQTTSDPQPNISAPPAPVKAISDSNTGLGASRAPTFLLNRAAPPSKQVASVDTASSIAAKLKASCRTTVEQIELSRKQWSKTNQIAIKAKSTFLMPASVHGAGAAQIASPPPALLANQPGASLATTQPPDEAESSTHFSESSLDQEKKRSSESKQAGPIHIQVSQSRLQGTPNRNYLVTGSEEKVSIAGEQNSKSNEVAAKSKTSDTMLKNMQAAAAQTVAPQSPTASLSPYLASVPPVAALVVTHNAQKVNEMHASSRYPKVQSIAAVAPCYKPNGEPVASAPSSRAKVSSEANREKIRPSSQAQPIYNNQLQSPGMSQTNVQASLFQPILPNTMGHHYQNFHNGFGGHFPYPYSTTFGGQAYGGTSTAPPPAQSGSLCPPPQLQQQQRAYLYPWFWRPNFN